MKKRGQSNETWMSRWRDGACPVHGGGFVEDKEAMAKQPVGVPMRVMCSVAECDVKAVRYAAGDANHASFGWRAGPENIHALLAKAGDIAPEGTEPGPRARRVRTSYDLETD
jgi:hypothetical protein